MQVKDFIIFFLFLTHCAYLPVQEQHTLRKGETLDRLAHRYQVDSQELAEHNNWSDISKYLPNDPQIKLTQRKENPDSDEVPLKKTAYTPTSRFTWPIHGAVSSKYGRRWGSFHSGIDILGSSGTPIKTAASGKVIYSGIEPGYGKLVIVYHGGGFSTVYAHASKLLVKKGQRVKRGQLVARVGSTGRSTGPHLHFEIRRGSDAENPLNYLP